MCDKSSVHISMYRGIVAMVAGQESKMSFALDFVKRQGSVRPRDLASRGLPGNYLDRLHRRGLIEKVARGVYAWPEADVSEHHSLAVSTRLVPQGIVCLLSALRFHGLSTQNPHEIWLALPGKAWAPKYQSPKLRVVRFSGDSLTKMIEKHTIEGVTVRIFSPAKTVADCFKFRNRIGLDVAIEALRDCWRHKKATMDDLVAAARMCRMDNVMRPYLESVV
jgi:predicted transcriptional regulator of viral defense system